MPALLNNFYQELKVSDTRQFKKWAEFLKYLTVIFSVYFLLFEVLKYIESEALFDLNLKASLFFLSSLIISYGLTKVIRHNFILFIPAIVCFAISIATFKSHNASQLPTWFLFQGLGLLVTIIMSDLRGNFLYASSVVSFPFIFSIYNPEVTLIQVILEQNIIYFGILCGIGNSYFQTIKAREEEKLNESMLLIKKSSDLGTWQWNLNTNHVSYDERWLEIIGYLPGELPNEFSTWENNVHPVDKASAQAQFEAYLSGKINEYEVKFRMKHKDGYWVPIIAKGKVLSYNNDGSPFLFSGTHFDLSKIERLELIANKNARLASLGKVASGIGHEINNPLAIIKGYTYLIQKSMNQTDEQIQGHFYKLNNAIERIKNITQALREFSKDDNEKYEYLDLSEVMGSSLNLLSDIYTNKGVVIKNLYNIENPVFVNANRGKIQQVILNLLSNAVDATKDKKDPEVRIYSSLEGHKVKIHIEDNGPGINKEIQPRIFDPFFSTKEVNTGTGIGLSLSHEIIKNHNGEISFASTSGKGTIFTFCLPLAEQEIQSVA